VTTSPVPVVDLRPAGGDDDARRTIAAAVDAALHDVGFLLVTGHGVDPALLAAARHHARTFFHLPVACKRAVAIDDSVYRGWVPGGAETNARAYGADSPPDLKETFVAGPHGRPDDAYHREEPRWYLSNRWPAEVPAMAATWMTLYDACEALALRLLALAELAMDVRPGTFTDACHRGISTLDANWYPPSGGAPPLPGQLRIGAHTDYGGLTILDREPGRGGLQIQLLDDTWVDAPYVPGALTVNTGDLISLWTAGRWRSTRHRVLAPPPDAPDEELLSLVFFHDPDHDAAISPLGDPGVEPVRAGDYLAMKLAALTGG
jgi:isopenicillin N synthase-like dioxygenase